MELAAADSGAATGPSMQSEAFVDIGAGAGRVLQFVLSADREGDRTRHSQVAARPVVVVLRPGEVRDAHSGHCNRGTDHNTQHAFSFQRWGAYCNTNSATALRLVGDRNTNQN
jgi:hypothetical protein